MGWRASQAEPVQLVGMQRRAADTLGFPPHNPPPLSRPAPQLRGRTELRFLDQLLQPWQSKVDRSNGCANGPLGLIAVAVPDDVQPAPAGGGDDADEASGPPASMALIDGRSGRRLEDRAGRRGRRGHWTQRGWQVSSRSRPTAGRSNVASARL